MKKPFVLQDAQIAKFWNDTHELTLILKPLETEPPIDPPIEPLETPTGIKLREIISEPPVEPIKPNIPTGLKLSTYNKESHGKRN